MKSEYQKMIAGEPYRPFDPELRALAQTARQKQASFNEEIDPIKGMEIIKGWFGSTGENLYVNTRLVVDLCQYSFGSGLWCQYSFGRKFLFQLEFDHVGCLSYYHWRQCYDWS